MITITARTIGLWFVALDEHGDWLGSACTTEDGDFEMIYRFRYYVDKEVFEDSKDKKSWYKGTVSKDHADKDKIIEAMRAMTKALWTQSGGQRYEIMMGNGGEEEFMDEMSKLPFTTMKTRKLDEEEL